MGIGRVVRERRAAAAPGRPDVGRLRAARPDRRRRPPDPDRQRAGGRVARGPAAAVPPWRLSRPFDRELNVKTGNEEAGKSLRPTIGGMHAHMAWKSPILR